MVEDKDIHHSAKALILEAAEKSGLLNEVAGMLWWNSKVDHMKCYPNGDCPACELLDDLAAVFDDHINLPARAVMRALACKEDETPDPSPATPEEEAEATAFI